MRCGLQIRPTALKELHGLADRERARIARRIDSLAGNPPPPGSEKMAGRGKEYRVRAGDCRVIHTVDDEAKMVTVEKVGHRGDVYRRR